MLVRLLYASRACKPADPGLVDAIVATSIANNPKHGVTGVLCYGNGIFMQALEGGRNEVSRLYQQLVRDARHEDIVLLHYEEILEREFAGWAMGLVNTGKVNMATILKYSAHGELDPYRTSGLASQALLKELIAGASIVGRTSERHRF